MRRGRYREYVAVPGTGGAVGRSELAVRRERLEREFADLQFDLGGLAYEMALRDDFSVDLLARRAARLQLVEAELGSVERLIRGEAG